MGLIVILVAAFVIAKTITNYRIDKEYARQGLDSPRMRMKLAQARTGEASPAAVARTRPGASGYFRELWYDAWDDVLQRHRARRAARKAGIAPPVKHRKPWWRYILDPIGEDSQPTPEAAGSKSPTPAPSAVPPSQPSPAVPPKPNPPPPPVPPPATPPASDPDPEPEPTPEKEHDMPENTATGDVHDVESCDVELNNLILDLDHVDNALDAIDQYIRSARDAVEHIEAFLSGKNVDGAVLAGMAQALEMLGPEAIKALIDGIAAAKAGVYATQEGLAPLREASELVGAADGSVLNGR